MISCENDVHRNRCLSAGMVNVILKPVGRSAVRRFILLALGDRVSESVRSQHHVQDAAFKSNNATQEISNKSGENLETRENRKTVQALTAQNT
jgi:hypothetical protein